MPGKPLHHRLTGVPARSLWPRPLPCRRLQDRRGSPEAAMITDMGSYLKYFDAVHRRSVRDIGMLPPEAEGWRPNAGEGENAWDIGQLVAHMAGSRLYFASAYRNEGWVFEHWPEDTSRRDSWILALERSADEFRRKLEGTP